VVTNNFKPVDNHFGIDIVARKDEAVKATLDGIVVFADWTLETGYVIGIQHKNNIFSIYKHNSTLLKEQGSFVKAGEPISIVGTSGELSTGPHLHFEIWYNGVPVDPGNLMIF
jgi:murein DD-endopeptidase MepM/ murein hydrolase activator NlpD